MRMVSPSMFALRINAAARRASSESTAAMNSSNLSIRASFSQTRLPSNRISSICPSQSSTNSAASWLGSFWRASVVAPRSEPTRDLSHGWPGPNHGKANSDHSGDFAFSSRVPVRPDAVQPSGCSLLLHPRIVRRVGVHPRAPCIDGFGSQFEVPGFVAVDLA